jgi:hypothetical protein
MRSMASSDNGQPVSSTHFGSEFNGQITHAMFDGGSSALVARPTSGT